jgi:hypothetical protein
VVAFLVATGTALLGLLAGAGAGRAAPAPAGLSVTLKDGVGRVHSEMPVTYLAVVRNNGPTRVTGTLQLILPPFATFQGGVKAGTWRIRVPAGRSTSRKARVRIGTID